MNTYPYSLSPFPSTDPLPAIFITGNVNRNENTLLVFYEMTGQLSEISIPSLAETPLRKDRLWESTCLELFLQCGESESYREFNFSPSGDWNVYFFKSYREGMAEDSAFAGLPFSVLNQPERLCVRVDINLNKFTGSNLFLKAGVSAVVKTVDDRMFYWALAHPSDAPDFHHPKAFIINL